VSVGYIGCEHCGGLLEHEDTPRRPTLVQTPPQGAGPGYTGISNKRSIRMVSAVLVRIHC